MAAANNLDDFSPRRQALDRTVQSFIDRSSSWTVRHWLLCVNLLALLLAGGAFLAPVFEMLRYRPVVNAIYFFYSYMCHQLPQRSYFIFGYQVAQCQRNTAIYGSLFAAGLAFALLRNRLKPLEWRLYGLLIMPMAVDGFTQLFGWRESNWELRTITGALFGIACVWLVYPRIEGQLRAAQNEQRVHRLVIYAKDGCSLCEKAKVIAQRLKSDYSLTIEDVDITRSEELFHRYRDLIPVIHIDGRVAAVGKVSEVWLRRTLDSLR